MRAMKKVLNAEWLPLVWGGLVLAGMLGFFLVAELQTQARVRAIESGWHQVRIGTTWHEACGKKLID